MMPVMTQFQVQKVLANELTELLNDLSVTGLEKCNISAVCFRKCFEIKTGKERLLFLLLIE